MLKVKINKGKIDELVVTGARTIEIIADVGLVINRMYFALKEQDEGLAEAYKESLKKLLGDDNSSVWRNKLG